VNDNNIYKDKSKSLQEPMDNRNGKQATGGQFYCSFRIAKVVL